MLPMIVNELTSSQIYQINRVAQTGGKVVLKPTRKQLVFQWQQEALKGFTTGPLVTSQTRTSPRFSRLHFRLFQVHPKFLGYSAHVTRSVTMRRNILTSA